MPETALIVVFLVLMFLGTPITWSLSAGCIAAIVLDPGLSFSLLCQKIFTGSDNFSMLAIPAFFLAGDIMAKGGLSKRLAAYPWFPSRAVRFSRRFRVLRWPQPPP
jgi:C4-dicarboxylate transporter DctM subunit